MRSPVLAISLVAAAIATASAHQAPPSRDVPLSPTQGNVGSSHFNVLRQYPAEAHGYDSGHAEENGRERGGINRGRPDGSRGTDRPSPPRLPPGTIPAATQGKSGGISVTSPVTGANADQGGGSASSEDGSPAPGLDSLNHYLPEALSPPVSQGSASEESDHSGYVSQPQDSAYAYRMKRVARSDERTLVYRRAGDLADIFGGGGSDDNSNHDGADGQSVRGSEHPGSGTHGGEAHAGDPGSAEGGHVYNYPEGNDT